MAGEFNWLDPLFSGIWATARALVRLPFQKTLNFSTAFRLTNNPAAGVTEIDTNNGTTGVRVRLPLVLTATSTQTSSSDMAIVGTRYLLISDYLVDATTVTLYALVGRVIGGAATVTVELYNESGTVSVASAGTAASPGEVSLDLSSLIGAPNALYSVRLYSSAAGTAALSVAELRIS